MREATVERKTKETSVRVRINVDGAGTFDGNTGIGFFDHMLNSLAVHSGFDLRLEAEGDLSVDVHHLVEDVGICLGMAMDRAIGSRSGISRFGHAVVPMDESLVLSSVDFSGRGFFSIMGFEPCGRIGDLDEEAIVEFFKSLAMNARATIHIKVLDWGNRHHRAEAMFKSVARSLRQAVAVEAGGNGVPSTKGTL